MKNTYPCLILITIVLIVTGLSACVPLSQTTPTNSTITKLVETRERGSVISVEHLDGLDRSALQNIATDFPGNISVQNGASLYRLTYWTVLQGQPVVASGLFSIPENNSQPKGVFAYFHGTNATRTTAPSQPDRVDGNEETAIYAGNNYYVVLPDYLGLGVSTIPQPYLITKPNVDASIDMLVATRQVIANMNRPWPSTLFMMGFSQGGQIVAGVHRALEKKPIEGLRPTASVGIAGPYDLRITSVPKALENECLLCVSYLAWASSAYSAYYKKPLKEALTPRYAQTVPNLFGGSKSGREIISELPQKVDDLFNPDFLSQIRANQDNWFTKALDENETYAWIPIAPIRLYFGTEDKDVTPEASQYFYDYAKPRGGNISLHSMGPVDHMDSASATQVHALTWFNQLSETK